jgi:membrane protein DedA with SNARE-associated domain
MDPASIMSLLLMYRYWILLPLAIVEGPMLAFVCGILASLGILNPLIALGILVLGDIIPDTVFYFLGRYGRDYRFVKRIAAKIGINDEHFADAEKLWREHPGKTMLMSKFAYGIAAAFLFMAGLMRMPVHIFYGYSVSISILHYAIIMLVGYFFGSSILAAGDIVTMIEIGAAGLALLVAAYVITVWYMRKRFAWKKDDERNTSV